MLAGNCDVVVDAIVKRAKWRGNGVCLTVLSLTL